MSKCFVCAGYVTYNPDIDLLKRSITAIIEQVNYIVIIDNGSVNRIVIEELRHLSSNIHIIFNESNNGVAVALNQIGRYAEQMGCKWFLTLDQDSVCPPNMVSVYSEYLHIPKVGLICPVILQRIKLNAPVNLSNTFDYIQVAITSGSLVRTTSWKDVGGFWNDLFIDRVDDDFCLALRDKQWKILQTNRVALEHQIGNPSLHTFMGLKFYTDSYPAFRYYYIARNTIVVCNYYKNLPYNKYKLLLKRFFKILFGESNKYAKLKAFTCGCVDGVKMLNRGLYRKGI